VSTRSSIAARGLASLGWRAVGLAERLQANNGDGSGGRTLAGDRDIEWGWSLAQLPDSPGLVLDFGAGNGILSAGAAARGHRVVAVDLEPCAFSFELDQITYRRGDLNELEFEPESFDYVINCSTTEHVGLAGRYSGSRDDVDADIRAMERLAQLLKPGAEMGLTIPVGRDAVFPPLHRVYGQERLPRLLAAFEVVTERYLAKLEDDRWREVDRQSALAEQGSRSYYALGLFRLRRPRTGAASQGA
jgi:SAM-dependent methyltransferase